MLRRVATATKALLLRTRESHLQVARLATGTTATSSSTDPQGWEKHEEPLSGYEQEGYLPVQPGHFIGDYRIISKLGWGLYSTVWLGLRKTEPTLAALKIFRADASHKNDESAFLRRMQELSPQSPGLRYLVQLRDEILIAFGSSHHLCLVLEPLSENLRSFASRWPDNRLPLPLVQRIARQLLLGVDYMHRECKIVHTDIKPSNIMTAAHEKDILMWVYHNVSRPICITTLPGGREVIQVRSSGNVPHPIPAEDPSSRETWANFTVKLGDFHSACWADKTDEYPSSLIQPSALRAPEVCIGSGWGPPADIWSLGCTIFELATGQSLFPPDLSNSDLHALLTSSFGEFPRHMVRRGRFSHMFYDADGALKQPSPAAPRGTLHDIFATRGGTQDHASLQEFLQYLFVLDPAQRPTAKDLLAHPWVTENSGAVES